MFKQNDDNETYDFRLTIDIDANKFKDPFNTNISFSLIYIEKLWECKTTNFTVDSNLCIPLEASHISIEQLNCTILTRHSGLTLLLL